MTNSKNNPYLDNNFNDRTNEVEALTAGILQDIKNDPAYYAELVADMYYHWKHNTFETGMMVMFHESVKAKQSGEEFIKIDVKQN